jgi:hypothetical protein
MATIHPAPQPLRFRQWCRSRRRCHLPGQCPSGAPAPGTINAECNSWTLSCLPTSGTRTTATPASHQGKTRKPHRLPLAARGFLLWRKSYTCRCPISFTCPAIHVPFLASQKQPPVHVDFDGTQVICGMTCHSRTGPLSVKTVALSGIMFVHHWRSPRDSQ